MQMRDSFANEAARLLGVEALQPRGDAARIAQLAAAAAGLLDGRTRTVGDAVRGVLPGMRAPGQRQELPTGASKMPAASESPDGSDVPTRVSWLRRLFGGKR